MENSTRQQNDGKKEDPSASKCNVCQKVYHNRYVRDFHENVIHNIGNDYTCYACLRNPQADKTEIYFKCVYSLHIHNDQHHEEKGFSLEYLNLH